MDSAAPFVASRGAPDAGGPGVLATNSGAFESEATAGRGIAGTDAGAVSGRGGRAASSPAVWPSSTSSDISSNLLSREEELDEELAGAAVCREQADVRAESLSSSAVVMEMVVSWGVNFSSTAVKCTATRATRPCQPRCGLTFATVTYLEATATCCRVRT